ncbi:MAG: hypothetical protein WBB82_11450 [Limnothrix sp.]
MLPKNCDRQHDQTCAQAIANETVTIEKIKLPSDPMDAFSPRPPEWIKNATHAMDFCCPNCDETPLKAERAWLNRYAPVTDSLHRRRWQEFYQCQCGSIWWAWSTDRPPSPYQKDEDEFRRGLI